MAALQTFTSKRIYDTIVQKNGVEILMSRSKFPKEVDSFPELFDLPHDKVQQAMELTELKSKPVLDNNEQNKLKALTVGLKDYLITPEFMNTLADCIVELEVFFDKNVRGYITDKQKEWDTYVKDFSFIGAWDKTKKYKRQNMITYQGDLYLVLKDHVATANVTPDKSEDFWKCSFKGDKGDIGLNTFYKGEWVGTKQYAQADAVLLDGVVYIANVDNKGKAPNVSEAEWFPYQPLMVGKVKPARLHKAVHFIRVLD